MPASVRSVQVLADARAVDTAHASGEDIRPLCGLAFAVKDNIDVAGYQTGADTPALQGGLLPSQPPPKVGNQDDS